MMSYRIFPQILVTFLVALSLVFSAVRVPDFSHPHRPKPAHRIVLESQAKAPSNYLNQHDHFAAVLPKAVESRSTISYRATACAVPQQDASLLSRPNLGRSPPAANI